MNINSKTLGVLLISFSLVLLLTSYNKGNSSASISDMRAISYKRIYTNNVYGNMPCLRNVC